MKTVTLGSHPNNLSLFVLRHRGVLEALANDLGYTIKWYDYANGGISADLLADGIADVVGTGCTPPVVASAQGVAIHYVAASLPRPANSALLSLQHNQFTDLRGKTIAAMVGSFTDHFLATLLNEHGWKKSDVKLVDLRGEAPLLALQNGTIDAWLAVDPWLQPGLALDSVHVLAQVGTHIPNRSIFWSHQAWSNENAAFEAWFVQQLAENDLWIAQNPEQAAALLQEHLPNNLSREHWLTTISQRQWGIEAANDTVLAEQNQQSLDLKQAGFIA
ncbi:ABC transporter substrate-binding protein [Vitreoscilla stercoraria]|uniref:ABC transporter substrate-binding protein n=1 Tax=Vitreoscilla stercoraria TaxID=61 RepID=A0ABY4E9S7_VITST|nr:ABC transporter substrate-binding protein [Vitreoscilla stercoraria]UOO92514.1 ABC transporter substrate-binding protein [Vitreoscilla stercoraria]